jgi:uncharacterized protein (TIGR03435 family)
MPHSTAPARNNTAIAIRFAVLFLMLLGTLEARPQTTEKPSDLVERFEVASFRISGDPIHLVSKSEPGAHEVFFKNYSLGRLIWMTFGDVDVQNQPKWFYFTHWTILATAPDNRALSEEELRLPLQHLLEERLHFQWHKKIEQVSGYALVVSKDGAKLTPTEGGKYSSGSSWNKEEGRMGINNAPISELAFFVGALLDRKPMVDETGLSGRYDVQMTFAMDTAVTSSRPTLPEVLHSLGLDIVKKKVNRETIIIDHVDEQPVDN